MYLLFVLKGWEPGRYWNMTLGERALAVAFLHREMEERREIYRSLFPPHR